MYHVLWCADKFMGEPKKKPVRAIIVFMVASVLVNFSRLIAE